MTFFPSFLLPDDLCFPIIYVLPFPFFNPCPALPLPTLSSLAQSVLITTYSASVSLWLHIVLFPSCLHNNQHLLMWVLFMLLLQWSTFRVLDSAGFLNTCPHLGAWPSINRSAPSSFPAALKAVTQLAQWWAATSATGNPTSASSTAPLNTSCNDS